ncbi:MAG TPA: DoxX family membrane protein [Propionibacteriaceae bacterium]
MSLLRAIPRTMLASYFVAAGIKAIRDPESLVPAAEPLVDRVVPLVKEYTPEQVAGYVPENTVTLVRLTGIAEVLGGAALATGKGRRLGALLLAGSLIPSTIAKHPFWTVQDPEARAQDRSHFLKNMSLLGGVLLAAQDTEGKPSLVWRARKGGETIAKETRKASKKLTKGSSNVADTATELAEGAVATGLALVEALGDSSRKVRRQAARQLKEAKAVAAHTAEEAQEAAAKAAKRAKKEAKKQAKVISKKTKKQAKVISKKAKKLGENVHLGEN